MPFYLALDSGARVPATPAQREFVACCRKVKAPQTAHEKAYIRYVEYLESADDADFVEEPASGRRGARDSLNASLNYGRSILRRMPNRASASATMEELKFLLLASGKWVPTVLADRELAQRLASWSAESFNTLSNTYTRAMDAGFGVMREGGVPPSWHRLFDGNHTLPGSMEAVRNAVPDDSVWEEANNWLAAFASDASSALGMPVVTLSAENYAFLSSSLERLGLSRTWTLDMTHYNAEEMLSAAIPGIAVLFCWNKAEQERFAEMVGALAISGAVAANPLLLMLVLVSAAQAYQKSRDAGALTDSMRGVAKGGVLSGIVIATSATVSGPILVGTIAGIVLALMARCAGRKLTENGFFSYVGVLAVDIFRKRRPNEAPI
ncbi:hypothetical protein GSH16_05365 [Rhodobacteraceae bacterium KN286]|uniref:Uncharacterized protein n=1 Tax=Oceanomicrobium pacificus TaxID=2692916 RepID=A0A6B0TUM9_9RHOB|nr:hypothetical protein [Oceanomicrobium pacificus]